MQSVLLKSFPFADKPDTMFYSLKLISRPQTQPRSLKVIDIAFRGIEFTKEMDSSATFVQLGKMTNYPTCLKLRQNKNDYIQSKTIPILKLPRFFPYLIVGEKARQF